MVDKKKLIIIGSILFVVLSLVIFFAVKSHKQIKKIEDENNYTIKFDYYFEEKLNQRITFIYENKKLKDITLTLYFEGKDVASAVYSEYKSAKEFKEYKLDKKKVIIYYKDEDVKDYKAYSKDELIQEFTSLGYVYKK